MSTPSFYAHLVQGTSPRTGDIYTTVYFNVSKTAVNYKSSNQKDFKSIPHDGTVLNVMQIIEALEQTVRADTTHVTIDGPHS